MADLSGQQLGHYQLLKLLGEGGFAEVYLGEHIHLGTQAAIKVLHTQLLGNDTEQFRAEARTIAHLVHPHIVRILDFGVESHTPYLVMDYAPNGTLRGRYPKGTQLELPRIVSYVKQAADALQYAHDQRLIHRDIKPENMLLGRNDELLLSDFGLALIAQSTRYQNPQNVAGTVAYMAPEQIQAYPRPASDQYSLGVVVYEWISGERPFNGSYIEIATKHALISPPSLRTKVPSLPPTVEDVVMTALAKDPHQRFASMRAFAAALGQASQPTQSTHLAPPPRPTPSLPQAYPPSVVAAPPSAPAVTPPLANSPPVQPGWPGTPYSWPQQQQSYPTQAPGYTNYPGYPASVVVPPKKSGVGKVMALLLVLVILLGAGAAAWFLYLSPVKSSNPPFDRHGLQSNVPLPNNITFQYKHTVTQSNITADEWIWKVTNSPPASVEQFYQDQLPQSGWTNIQTISGSTIGVLGCQGEQVLIIGISIHLQDNNDQGTPTITDAPTGGSALGIALSTSLDLRQNYCQNPSATPTP